MSFTHQTTLITGANRGIGLELARQLSAQGARVIAAHRRESSPELSALNITQLPLFDVCDEGAVKDLPARLKALGVTRLDVLINNAGLFLNESLGELDFEAIRRQFEVNTLGPLRVTESALPFLTEGSKVAHVTSRMGSITDNTSGAYYGYRASKAALNAVAKSLSVDLAPKGVSVVVLHPGFVRTEMVLKER